MKARLFAVLGALVCFLVVGVAYADVEKGAIKSKVDEIVMALDAGKTAADFVEVAKLKPHYVYILEEKGKFLVHPSLVDKSLKEVAPPVFTAIVKATPEGLWVKYQWKGAEKNAYVRKTAKGLIVGSGY